jgi:hypothetical protein
MRIVMTFIVVLGLATAAAAQTPPAAAPAAPAAAPPQPETKAVDCRAEALSKGLRGPDTRDSIALCREELKLACLKEAIGKKIVGPERREFVRACAARPGGGERRGNKG